MNTSKSVGFALLGIAVIVGLATLAAALVYGAVWVSEQLVEYVIAAVWLALANCIVVLAPLALFRGTRIAAVVGFMICSCVFGTCTWILALLTAYLYWGLAAIVIGLLLGGVGVVPIGMLAALFNADWYGVIGATIGLVLAYGTRAIALWLASLVDRAEEQRRLKIIEGEVAR